MKPAAQAQASIDLLDQVIDTGYPADRIMAQYFRSHRYIGSKDKAAISEHLYTVLRQRLSLEYLLTLADLPKHNRFLIALMLHGQGCKVTEYFNGEGYNPKSLPEEDVIQLENIDFSVLDNAPQHVQLNVPEWLAEKLVESLGDRFVIEMQASNQRACTDIRVNLLKSNVDQVKDELDKVGFVVEKGRLSPWGLRFKQRVALFGIDSFKKGWFEIQDEGSQLLALLSGVEAGQKVVDFCAGAGGKTLAMAAMMSNKGVIYACDVHTKRLKQLSLRLKRAGAHNVRTHVLSSEQDKWVKQHRGIADVVLVDAPCSGTGTWRRSPDSRWNLKPENLANLIKLQQSILQSAARLVKPGGRLYYATCSLLIDENDNQISEFLRTNENFELGELILGEKLQDNSERMQLEKHQLKLLPALSDTDGFYICALTRKI